MRWNACTVKGDVIINNCYWRWKKMHRNKTVAGKVCNIYSIWVCSEKKKNHKHLCSFMAALNLFFLSYFLIARDSCFLTTRWSFVFSWGVSFTFWIWAANASFLKKAAHGSPAENKRMDVIPGYISLFFPNSGLVTNWNQSVSYLLLPSQPPFFTEVRYGNLAIMTDKANRWKFFRQV